MLGFIHTFPHLPAPTPPFAVVCGGKVVEHGTHNELMQIAGTRASIHLAKFVRWIMTYMPCLQVAGMLE